ncbi:MAG: hypothetical protein LBE13_20255 [Bacteroidales bacterium]|jgi:energy-coupling factor transporter ATP-binding protein EcfA2|nr:hypothetical protein [Bacteroidales bacterium]
MDFEKIIETITSHKSVNNTKLFLNSYQINYYSTCNDDVNYLQNFLHSSRSDQSSNFINLYVSQSNKEIKINILNIIDLEADKLIRTHLINSHYYHLYVDDNDIQVFIYYPIDTCYFILVRGNDYLILFDDDYENKKSLPLYIIREIIYREYENSDLLCFHAAACKLVDAGVIIIGPPGSGKTTLLFSLIEHQSGTFISNDRALIGNQPTKIYTLPMPIRLNFATVNNSRALLNYINENSATLCRKQSVDDNQGAVRNKIELTPLEVSRCFNKDFQDNAPLKLLIIPEFCDINMGEIKIIREDIEIAKATLKEECYTPNDPLWIEPWFFRKNINKDDVTKKIENIANNVPIFKVRYGKDIGAIIEKEAATWFYNMCLK